MTRLGVMALGAVAGLAQELAVGHGVNFYTKEKEAALGRSLAQELRKTTPALNNPVVQAYVESVVARLAGRMGADAPEFRVEVAIIERREPAAVPGGYLFVPTGLLLEARDELDFATQVAHGMAHIAARHGTRQATRGEIAGMGSTPLVYLGGWSTWHGEAAIPRGMREYHRKYEVEADRLAALYVAGGGFVPAPEAFAAARAEVRAAVAATEAPRKPPTLRR